MPALFGLAPQTQLRRQRSYGIGADCIDGSNIAKVRIQCGFQQVMTVDRLTTTAHLPRLWRQCQGDFANNAGKNLILRQAKGTAPCAQHIVEQLDMSGSREIIDSTVHIERAKLNCRIKNSLFGRPECTSRHGKTDRLIFGAHGPENTLTARFEGNIQADERNEWFRRLQRTFR